MKTLVVMLSILGLSVLGYLIIYGSKTSTQRSSIFMHPSNFDKEPREQVYLLKKDSNHDIPTPEELQKELSKNS